MKKVLKILLTNNHLVNFGGSETFTYTIWEELKKRGYKVDVFTFEKGEMSEKFGDDIVNVPQKKYDLILNNHNTCLKYLLDNGIKGFKINTCHGVIHGLEKPISGADFYVAISEEVKKYLLDLGFSNDIIYGIRNGININRFKPKTFCNVNLNTILCACQGTKAREKIINICKKMGIKCIDINKRVWNIEDLMNEADLVVGLGRTALEGMSCGKNVLVYDERDYMEEGFLDGLVDSYNIFKMRENNLSGRKYKIKATEDNIINELQKYEQQNGGENRYYIQCYNNVKDQVNKYLNIYEKYGQKI